MNIKRSSRRESLSLSSQHPSNGFVRVIRSVRPGIVSIVTEERTATSSGNWMERLLSDLHPPRENSSVRRFGSGFVISSRGLILTNEHVIRNSGPVRVQLHEGKRLYPSRTVWTDPRKDLAILQIRPPRLLKPLRLGSSGRLEVGEWVVAVGNPLGLDQTVTVGIISGKDRPLEVGNRFYSHVIQTDAAINPGNSGGPLINILGEVVGINTLVAYPSQSISFAIPIDEVKPLIRSYLEGG
ncbi:S1C family serine protease [Paludifilum halophilum]|uniref:Serine protease n=1 Tax=Paludifilum halophilum TaxID=1642702 RepID=A0A235BBV0_9BACL|nr:trypsin-like peptidase domain-containing protein [Paludifilum halophilum]OYD09055.1 hypothetical protein CHM34_04610 [Paludifilum halophilum]